MKVNRAIVTVQNFLQKRKFNACSWFSEFSRSKVSR